MIKLKNREVPLKRIVFLASIIIAVIFSIQVLGKQIIITFHSYLPLENPSFSCLSDSMESVIIDRSRTRLVFLNRNGKVSNIVSLDNSTPLSVANGVETDGEYFYVFGSKYARNTNRIQADRIVRYSMTGRHNAVLYEFNRENDPFNLCKISELDICDGEVYLTMNEPGEGEYSYHASVAKIDTDPKTDDAPETILTGSVQTPFCAAFAPSEKALYSSDYYGALYRETENGSERLKITDGRMARYFVPLPGGQIAWSDPKSWNVLLDREVICDRAVTGAMNYSGNLINMSDSDSGVLLTYHTETGTLTQVENPHFTLRFGLLAFLRSMSVTYLAGLILLVFAKALIAAKKEGNTELLKKTGFAAAAVAASLLISGFYIARIGDIYLTSLTDELKTVCSFFAKTADMRPADAILEFSGQQLSEDSENAEAPAEVQEYEDYYGSYVESAEADGKSLFVCVYRKEGNLLRTVYSSDYEMQIGESFFYDELENSMNQNKFRGYAVSAFLGDTLLSTMKRVTDDSGEVVGCIEVGCDYNNYMKQTRTDIFEMTMVLLTIFTGIFIVYIEGTKLVSGLRERKIRISRGDRCPEISVIRSLRFFTALVTEMDTVILVLITKELLAESGFSPDKITMLIALPSFAVGIGFTTGTILYNMLVSRFEIKKLCVSSAFIMLISFSGLAFALINKNFLLFVLLKFVVSAADNITYATVYAMPYRAESESERFAASRESSMGAVSCSILGAMLGGLIADKFGNTALYVANAAAVIPLILMLFAALPDHCYYVSRNPGEKTVQGLKNFAGFIMKPAVLSFVFFLLVPSAIAVGYKSYIFPLYSSALSLPKLYVTNFYVFARVLMMLVNKPVSESTKNIERWKLSIAALMVMGISYACFALNSTIVWAVIMLFIMPMLDKIIANAKTVIWPREAQAEHLNVVQLSGYMGIFENVLFSMKEAVLSCFVLLGNVGCCIALGVFCMACAVLFALTTRKSALSRPAA